MIIVKQGAKQITLSHIHKGNVAAMMEFGLTRDNAEGLLSAIAAGDLAHAEECGFKVEKVAPVSTAEILAALAAGKFEPLSETSRMAYLDAGKDALVWVAPNLSTVIVCTDEEDGRLIIEVYGADNDVWQGNALLEAI